MMDGGVPIEDADACIESRRAEKDGLEGRDAKRDAPPAAAAGRS